MNIAPRWASDNECAGAYLALGGDLISGDIHEELVRTNALTAHQQVQFVVEQIGAGIRMALEAFGAVHVASVPGNHGRTTRKPTAKLYSQLSYDTFRWLNCPARTEAMRESVTVQFGPAGQINHRRRRSEVPWRAGPPQPARSRTGGPHRCISLRRRPLSPIRTTS